jgi:hypothetical protein
MWIFGSILALLWMLFVFYGAVKAPASKRHRQTCLQLKQKLKQKSTLHCMIAAHFRKATRHPTGRLQPVGCLVAFLKCAALCGSYQWPTQGYGPADALCFASQRHRQTCLQLTQKLEQKFTLHCMIWQAAAGMVPSYPSEVCCALRLVPVANARIKRYSKYTLLRMQQRQSQLQHCHLLV